MAQQIKKKFIADDAIDGSKLKLLEGEAVRLQTPAGEVELLKKDAQGKLVSEGEEISFKDDMEAHVESVRVALQANIDSEESARIADVDSEESRAMGVESSLQSQITQEISDRQADVDAEQSRAEGVEASLQSQLTQEISDRQSEVTRVEGLLSTEESARIAGDLNLQNQIDNVLSNIDPTALDSLTEIVAAFQEADGSLQGAISTLAGNSSGNISAEQSRAEAAEASLQAQINQEISDRQADVDAEESRAMGVESSLQSQITQEISDRMADVDAEESRAMGVESGLDSRLSTAESDIGFLELRMDGAESDISVLQSQIFNTGSDVSGVDARLTTAENDIDSLESDLALETSNRISDVNSEESRAVAAELFLQNQINAEITSRQNAVSSEQSRAEGVESSLQSQITQEISDRVSAVSSEESRAMSVEASLQSQITQEISDRIADVDVEESRAMAVEASLQSQISQEISDRQADVDAEQSRAEGVEASLQAQITQEISDRQADIDAEQSRAEAAEASLQSQIDNVLSNLDPAALDSLTEIVAAFQTADSSLQGAISTLASNSSGNIEAEESRAMAAEASLQSQISQEISDRQAAISAEASSRSAEDLTFVKLDGSRNMTGGLTIANPSHVGTIQIGEEDDTLKLNYVDSANLYGGGTFTTALYSGAVDITHSSGRNSFLSDTGLNVTGNGNVSAVSSGAVSVNNGANGRVTLGQGAVSIFDGATGTNPKMPTQNYHATPKKYVDDEINAEESRALAVEGSLQSQISQEISDRAAAVSAEESARIAEDLTFFKKDGSREMTGSIIPSVTLSFDIGSPTKRFKDIYLSGSTIDLGGVTLSNESNEFIVRDASNNELAIVSDNVREGSVNKFFLESRVQETEMSMLDVTKSGEVVSTDSLVDAVSKLQNQMTQEISDRQDDVDTEESRALAAEGILDGRLDVLEALAFEKESFTLGVNPTGVTLAHSPKAKSTVMFVGRLALHEGLDYSISGNQVTFIGDFAYDSEDEIAAAEGDVVKVTYYY